MTAFPHLIPFAWICSAAIAASEPASSGQDTGFPHLTGQCLVAPSIFAVTIEAGKVAPGRVMAYEPEQGDELTTKKEGKGRDTIILNRGGRPVGEVVGNG